MSAFSSLSVLVVGDDPQLAAELEAALTSATHARTAVRFRVVNGSSSMEVLPGDPP